MKNNEEKRGGLTIVARERKKARPLSVILLERRRFRVRAMGGLLRLTRVTHKAPFFAKDSGTVGIEGLQTVDTLDLASKALEVKQNK
jgi:hypothetical protein